MTTRSFGMGPFGRPPFDKEARKKFQEEWSKMTDEEKLNFMNRKVEQMEKGCFSVEAIDARAEEWMKMTPEEKQEFVDKKREAFEHMHDCHAGFHGQFAFGHGFPRRGMTDLFF